MIDDAEAIEETHKILERIAAWLDARDMTLEDLADGLERITNNPWWLQ